MNKEWKKCLRKIQHSGYNRFYRQKRKDEWHSKLSTISNTWRKYYYQIEGSRKKSMQSRKKYKTMDERLASCLKSWKDKRRLDAWTKTLENIRTNWRDRRKRLEGRCVDEKR